MDVAGRRALGRYGRFAAVATGLAAGLAASGLVLLGGVPGGAGAAALGCAVSLAASLLAAWPVARLEARLGRAPAAVALAGSAVRPVLAIAGALALVVAGVEPLAPLLIAVAVSYLVLLVPDSLYARGALKTTKTPSRTQRRDTETDA